MPEPLMDSFSEDWLRARCSDLFAAVELLKVELAREGGVRHATALTLASVVDTRATEVFNVAQSALIRDA